MATERWSGLVEEAIYDSGLLEDLATPLTLFGYRNNQFFQGYLLHKAIKAEIGFSSSFSQIREVAGSLLRRTSAASNGEFSSDEFIECVNKLCILPVGLGYDYEWLDDSPAPPDQDMKNKLLLSAAACLGHLDLVKELIGYNHLSGQ